MSRPKVGLFAKNVVYPPSLTHLLSSLPQFIFRKFIYDHGMANNFRRVLNCVALLCCEIEEIQKWPSDEIRHILKIYTFQVRKIKVLGLVREASGDIGASKYIKNNSIIILQKYLKCVCLLGICFCTLCYLISPNSACARGFLLSL